MHNAVQRIDRHGGIEYDTDVARPQIVIDTNVLIAALRSQYGTAYRLLLLVGTERFDLHLSVPLTIEYEQVAKGMSDELGLSTETIDDILNYLCRIAGHQKIFYLWRPFLIDPKDDMVLELAVAAQCKFIVTYNKKDFGGSEQFGIQIVTPFEFLEQIGEAP